jgi:murein DD-endopeptidase MepM/ murein hydrolase activator NlpD
MIRICGSLAASLFTLVTAVAAPAGDHDATPTGAYDATPTGAYDATTPTTAGGYQWPLRPAPDRIVRNFDPPPLPWLRGNRGLDLAGRPGQAVHAVAPGLVTFAGPVAGVGVVVVTTGPLRDTFEPVRPTVAAGRRVRPGAVIGRLTLAGSHCPPAACLHWGLLRGTEYLDPLALLGLERVRLLPLG